MSHNIKDAASVLDELRACVGDVIKDAPVDKIEVLLLPPNKTEGSAPFQIKLGTLDCPEEKADV